MLLIGEQLCGSCKQPHPGSQTYVGLLEPIQWTHYGSVAQSRTRWI